MRNDINLNRRADVKAALRRAKPDDVLTLENLAIIWGTTKPRFVTKRNEMVGFPDPMAGQGNVYLYPARKALEAMLAYEMRHEKSAQAKAARTAAILGRNKDRGASDATSFHTANELATLNRLAAETEEREREQGMYVPVAANAALAGEIFSEISEFHRELSNKLDPHGLLPAEHRGLIDKLGEDFLLRLHRRMKDVLSPDAKPRRNRTPARRGRRAQA